MGLVELLSKYDAILSEHVTKVGATQKEKKRFQVHYLLNKIQNEFVDLCGSFVQNKLLMKLMKLNISLLLLMQLQINLTRRKPLLLFVMRID